MGGLAESGNPNTVYTAVRGTLPRVGPHPVLSVMGAFYAITRPLLRPSWALHSTGAAPGAGSGGPGASHDDFPRVEVDPLPIEPTNEGHGTLNRCALYCSLKRYTRTNVQWDNVKSFSAGITEKHVAALQLKDRRIAMTPPRRPISGSYKTSSPRSDVLACCPVGHGCRECPLGRRSIRPARPVYIGQSLRKSGRWRSASCVWLRSRPKCHFP
jgi:hypothetical protein